MRISLYKKVKGLKKGGGNSEKRAHVETGGASGGSMQNSQKSLLITELF